MSNEKLTAQVYIVSPNGPPRAKIVVAAFPGSDNKKNDLYLEASGSTGHLLALLSETIANFRTLLKGDPKLVEASIKAAVDHGFTLARERQRHE